MPPGELDKPGESEITRNDTDAIPEVDVTEEMLRGTQDDPESWLLYGGGYWNQRHAVNETITPENVGDLSREWSIHLGDLPGEYQGSPLLVPGDPPVMYQTNGPDHIRAIDARTGDVLWHYDYDPRARIGAPGANRGVQLLGDTVYITTLDMGIVALDRYTAEEQWYFNQASEYLGQEPPEADMQMHPVLLFPRNIGFASSIPPIYFDGKLLKGTFGGDFGISGWIDAVDTDGEHAWRFDTTPQENWVGRSYVHSGATVWQPPAVDPDTGTAVFPVGNPGPDFDGTVRPGWNEYSAGKLALDLDGGEYEWHFQESPHDWWDYDSPSPPFIFEAEAHGEHRKLVSWPGKTGWLYTLDVETGKLIERSEEVCQHINTWALPKHEDIEETPWVAPSFLGGTDPQPPAYDPGTRTAVVKGQNRPFKISWTDAEYRIFRLYWGLDRFRFAEDGEDVPGWNGNGGFVAGVDPVTGERKWVDWRPMAAWGSAMTTATGLTFAGTAGGELVAYDTETGERVWSADLGPGVDGDPVSWYDPGTGKQYVAVQAGGGGPNGGFGEKGDLLAVYSLSG